MKRTSGETFGFGMSDFKFRVCRIVGLSPSEIFIFTKFEIRIPKSEILPHLFF
jgi:hypothetical protein